MKSVIGQGLTPWRCFSPCLAIDMNSSLANSLHFPDIWFVGKHSTAALAVTYQLLWQEEEEEEAVVTHFHNFGVASPLPSTPTHLRVMGLGSENLFRACSALSKHNFGVIDVLLAFTSTHTILNFIAMRKKTFGLHFLRFILHSKLFSPRCCCTDFQVG